MTLDDLRRQMRFPAGHVNLNAGSLSPVPESTRLKAEEVRRLLACDTHRFFFHTEVNLIENARAALAAFLRCGTQNLLLLPNVTWAINVAFRSLAGGSGTRAKVLTSDLDYGSLRHLLERFRRGPGDGDAPAFEVVEVRVSDCRSHAEVAERFRAMVGRHADARAMFLPHVAPATGWELPAASLCELARDAGMLSIVDGAHAPGAIDVDLSAVGADAYGGNCHKWMMAPAGAGFLHASDAFAPLLRPLVWSWGEKNRAYLPEHESAAGDAPGASATYRRDAIENHGASDRVSQIVLPDAIGFLGKLRVAGAHQHILDLKGYLLAEIAKLRPDVEAGKWLEPALMNGSDALIPMTAFTFPPCRRKGFWKWMLDHHDVAVIATRPREDLERPDHAPDVASPYFMRVCTAWFDTKADVDRLIVALRDVFEKRPMGVFD